MLLDLLEFAYLVSDLVDSLQALLVSQVEHFSLSTFCVFTIIGLLLYFCWKSTEVGNVPNPPSPPYVIQIRASGNNQSLSDVRLLSNGSLDTILQSLSSSHARLAAAQQQQEASRRREQSDTTSTAPSSSRNNNNNNSVNNNNSGSAATAVFLGFLRRPATRALIPIRTFRARVNISNGNNVNVTVNSVSESSPSPDNGSIASGVTGSSDSFANVTDSPRETSSVSTSNQEQSRPSDDQNLESPAPGSSWSNLHEASGGVVTSEDSVLRLRKSGNEKEEVTSNNRAAEDAVEVEADQNHIMPNAAGASTTEVRTGTEAVAGSANDVRITIKFLNDTQREVITQLKEKILDFKRRNFSTELDENKIVRLIFNGRVLDNDASTLRDFGVYDQCVMHCLIISPETTGRSPDSGSYTRTTGSPRSRFGRGLPGNPEPGMFFVSILGVVLLFLWFICFHFGQQLFTQSAVISLVVLTAVFVIGVVALYLPVQPNNNH